MRYIWIEVTEQNLFINALRTVCWVFEEDPVVEICKLRVDLLRTRIFSRWLDEVTLTITREIVPVHAKPAGFIVVRWSQGSTSRKYVAHDTYSSIFAVHKLRQTELTNDGRSKWRLWPLRPAVSCTRGGADWPKVVAVGAQQPISDFLGFIQMRDTLSTNGEHLRVAEVKSFPAISKSMRSVNGDQNGANLKKWSVLLVCTIPRRHFDLVTFHSREYSSPWAFFFGSTRPSQRSQISCRWGPGSIARLMSVIKCQWMCSKVWRIQFTKESFPRLGEIHEWHTNQTLENSNSEWKKKDILCFCFQSKQKQKERINKYMV